MTEFVAKKMSGRRTFKGLWSKDAMDRKFEQLAGLCLRVLWSTLDAAVGLIRIVPLLVYFLVVFWFVLIRSFLDIVRNTNSDHTTIQIVKAIIFFPPTVLYNVILGHCIHVLYGPLLESVLFVFQNMMAVYGMLKISDDIE